MRQDRRVSVGVSLRHLLSHARRTGVLSGRVPDPNRVGSTPHVSPAMAGDTSLLGMGICHTPSPHGGRSAHGNSQLEFLWFRSSLRKDLECAS